MKSNYLKIGILLVLFLVPRFMKGMPVQYTILPLVLCYLSVINIYEIYSKYLQDQNRYWQYALIGFNLVFGTLAGFQIITHLLSFNTLLGLIIASALLHIGLIYK